MKTNKEIQFLRAFKKIEKELNSLGMTAKEKLGYAEFCRKTLAKYEAELLYEMFCDMDVFAKDYFIDLLEKFRLVERPLPF